MRGMLLLVAGALAAFAQPGSGWRAMGTGGRVESRDGAVLFAYDLQPKQSAMAVLGAPPELVRMQCMRFRVRASHDTPLVVILSEKKPGGGNYTAVF